MKIHFPRFGNRKNLGWLRQRLKSSGMSNHAIKRTSIRQMRGLAQFIYPPIAEILECQPMTRWDGAWLEVEYAYGVDYANKNNDLRD